MGFRESITSLDKKYGVFRAAKFGLASAAGFLIAEFILILGVLVIYGKPNLPSNSYSSPTLISLNVVAFGLGVTAGFFINESITVKNTGAQREKGIRRTVTRLLKFQFAYLLGNIVTVGVQLGLLYAFSITPILGNIAGAIAAYPLSYFFSMRYVWKLGVTPQAREQREYEEGEGLTEQPINSRATVSEETIRADLENIMKPRMIESLFGGQEQVAELTRYRFDVEKNAGGIMIDVDLAIHVRKKT